MSKEVCIVSAARTPIGSFMGSLSTIAATKLGSIAIKGAIEKINLNPNLIDEVYMGQVVQAGAGQAPARQASIFAGIPKTVPCTTINKVCASGLKAIMQGAQSISNGDSEIVIAGGMENMSLIPHYYNARKGKKFGPIDLVDGMLKDGLVDVYSDKVMGICAEKCAEKYSFSRTDQDKFAIESYKRSTNAQTKGHFDNEIIPVEISQRNGEKIVVKEDEEIKNINLDKIPKLKAAFKKNGTITAANASKISDGAAAVILMSKDKAEELQLNPLATIVSYADAAVEPYWFTIAPSVALPLAAKKGKIKINDIDFFEINEAFSVVGLANSKILNIDPKKINVFGGAVSMGHPLGCSGTRIIVTLLNVINSCKGKIGAAAICNGGGGASALIVKKN